MTKFSPNLSNKDRLFALKSSGIMDSPGEVKFDHLLKLCNLIVDCAVSFLGFVDENRIWLKSKIGTEENELSYQDSFCEYVIHQNKLVCLEDITNSDDVQKHEWAKKAGNYRFFLGLPITDKNNFVLGALVMMDMDPKKLSGKQLDGLDMICKQVSHLLTGQVSSEKVNEELFLANERKFRSFFENNQGLMLTHDMEGRFLSINNYGANLLGYEVNEIMGKSLYDIIPEKYHDEVPKYFNDLTHTGKAKGLVTTVQRNGNFKVWLYSNTVEEDIHGEKYVLGNSVDVTDRLVLEKNMHDTKELLNQTQQMARIGGWKYDLKKGVITWTEITRSIHEVEEDYFPDKQSATEFYKEGFSKDRIKELIERSISHGESWDEKLLLVTATGKEKWVRTIGGSHFENGKCVELFGTLQDIDEQVRSEQGLKQREQMLLAISKATDELLSNSDIYAAIANSLELIGKAVNVDRVYFFQNGYDENNKEITSQKSEWNSGSALPQIENPDLQKMPMEMFGDFIAPLKNKNSFQAIVSGLPEDSSTRKILEVQDIKSILVIPVFNREFFWGFIGYDECKYEKVWQEVEISLLKSFSNSVSNAISRSELENSLIKSKEIAESANKAKSEFLTNMSHEILTPLNGVVGFTDLLLKTNLNSTQRQYLDIVNESANTLLNIINDILDFSKIEAGKLELNIQKSDIYKFSGQIADIMSFEAQKKGLEILLSVSNNLPRFFYIDNSLLKQVLVNLLGNAIKFTENGEIEFKITKIGDFDNGYGTFRFEVRDTGIGIPTDKQTKIFEAFSQEDSSTTKKYGGTGLGLTISNTLLSMMGSGLILSSEPGSGSIFYFDLTIRTEEDINMRKVIDFSRYQEFLRKILVVDDNENSRRILKEMFASMDPEIDEADDGLEAIRHIGSRSDYDLIILDYHMPYMDGIETVQKMREIFYHNNTEPPILFLHNSSENDDVLRICNELKIHYRLTKPVKIKELADLLNRIFITKKKKSINIKKLPGSKNQRKYKILIAEDNLTNMLLTKTIISKISPKSKIIGAKNGLEAYEFCVQSKPDIIFMDIQMPIMNGYEATEKIRTLAHCAKVPIIALTAGNLKGEKEKCIGYGMVDFLTKPVTEDVIQATFEKWTMAGLTDGAANQNRQPTTGIVQSTENDKLHFDPETLKEYIGDQPKAIKDILYLTIEELLETPDKLQECIRQKSLAELNAAGHKLKGSSLTAGLGILLNISLQLENWKEWNEPKILELCEVLENETKTIIQLIHNYLKDVPG